MENSWSNFWKDLEQIDFNWTRFGALGILMKMCMQSYFSTSIILLKIKLDKPSWSKLDLFLILMISSSLFRFEPSCTSFLITPKRYSCYKTSPSSIALSFRSWRWEPHMSFGIWIENLFELMCFIKSLVFLIFTLL